MSVRLHAHAEERLAERGATRAEIIATIIATVEHGETFPAKFGRRGSRRNFVYNSQWRGRS